MNEKNIKNEMEVTEMDNINEVITETEETVEVDTTVVVQKPKWSLKKKLMIGGGVIVGLILGACAVGLGAAKTTEENTADDYSDDSEDNQTDEETETEETISNDGEERDSSVTVF